MDLEDVARRLRLHGRWRWQPGCLARSTRTGRWWRIGSEWGRPMAPDGETLSLLGRHECRLAGELFVPDLEDPATLGVLLALVREAEDEGLVVAWPPRLDGLAVGSALIRAWEEADTTPCFSARPQRCLPGFEFAV